MTQAATNEVLRVLVPPKLEPLCFYNPSRYKGAYGGRGGAKSHFFAEQLILKCYQDKTRAVCIREVQNSIRDSVRQLLIDKIAKLGLGFAFEVLEAEIRCKTNGGLIIFRGMQSYNAENIKSLEDFDVAWVEEAQTLSEHSLRLLRPTIRKPNSEIWFSWNPRHDTDPVDRMFRGGGRLPDAVSVEVNWIDNPWFPDVLKQEMEVDYENNPELAEHVWGGGYEIISEASYYARLIHAAEQEGRIGSFPHNPLYPVLTSWDIGVDDYTSIVFWQDVMGRPYVIDFWETSGEGAEEIVRQALPELIPDEEAVQFGLDQLGRQVPYNYKQHIFPHDVRMREWGSGGRSRYQTLTGFGVKPIKVGANLGKGADEIRVNAVRQLLPDVRFNDTPRVRVLISHLRRYSRKRNEQLGIYTGALHDEHSHASDAFGEFAINYRVQAEEEKLKSGGKPKELEYVARPDGVIAGNMDVRKAVEAMVKRRGGE